MGEELLHGLKLRGEPGVEVAQDLLPGELPFLDAVQIGLHLGGEVLPHRLREVPAQEVRDNEAQKRGFKAPVFPAHVTPLLDHRNDLGVGGGSTNPLLLQLLHEPRLRVALGRLRFLFLHKELRLGQTLPKREIRKHHALIGKLFQLEDPPDPRELHPGSGGHEPRSPRRIVTLRRRHTPSAIWVARNLRQMRS